MKHKNKRRLILSISLILLVIFYIFKNTSFLIRVIGVIFGLGMFYFIDNAFKLDFKLRHYIYMILILFGGVLFSPLYSISERYDKILHLIMPVLGSVMIFFVVNKLKIKFQWKLLITFTSMMTLVALLEIGEYVIDLIWDFRLQGVFIRDIYGLEKFKILMDPLNDTMIDMALGLAGSLIFITGKTACYLFKKTKIKK